MRETVRVAVVDGVGEGLGAEAPAQREAPGEAEVEVSPEADVGGVDVGVHGALPGRVAHRVMAGHGLRRAVVARRDAELPGVREAADVKVPTVARGEPQHPGVVRLGVAVAPGVLREAREVLAHEELAQKAIGAHRGARGAVGHVELHEDPVTRRRAALEGVVGAVEGHEAAVDVARAHHPGAVEARDVRLREHAEGGVVRERPHVLPVDRRARRRAVLAEAVAARELPRDEGLAALPAGREEREGPGGAEHPVLPAQEHAALLDPEVEPRAARDGEVTLPGVVGPFEHAQAVDHLGDHPVEVGVALPVHVRDVVRGHSADRELHVLPVLRVEAPEEDLVGLAVAAVLREEEPRREREELRGAAPRHRAQLADVEVELRRRPRRTGAAHRGPLGLVRASLSREGEQREERRKKGTT
ncbi:MAG: hypothetical protein U0325_04350 [Polyangiales bacterium]